MLVFVTKKHIELGVFYNPYFCPVAIALSDCLGGRWLVETYRITDLINCKTYNTPTVVSDWIERLYYLKLNDLMNINKNDYLVELSEFSFILEV